MARECRCGCACSRPSQSRPGSHGISPGVSPYSPPLSTVTGPRWRPAPGGGRTRPAPPGTARRCSLLSRPGVALAYGMLQGHPSANPNLALLNVVIPAALFGSLLPMLGCLLVARGYSNREVKRTILAGQAAAYWTSPDTLCWWDGTQWVRVSTAAPEGALRSPDGSYWWTGHSWLALPPRLRRRRGVAGRRHRNERIGLGFPLDDRRPRQRGGGRSI